MRRILPVILMLAMLLSLPVGAVSFNRNQVNKEIPRRLSNTLKAGIAAEVGTQTLIYSENAEMVIPAYGAVTRLMAAVAVELESEKTTDIRSDFDTAQYENLLAGMLMNDSEENARQLAITVSGSVESFGELINTTARQLGMSSTFFANVTGESDRDSVTTLSDVLILAYEAYGMSNIKSILSSNVYYTSNRELSFSRSANILDPEHIAYSGLVNFFTMGNYGDDGLLTISGSMSSDGREALIVLFESDAYAINYIGNYAADIKIVQATCFSQYYRAELAQVASTLVSESEGIHLADGTTVFCAVEVLEGEKTSVTLPVSYGLVIQDNYKDCTLEYTDLPESCGLDEIVTTAVMKYKNDTLLKFKMRVTRIVYDDGRELRKEYSQYSIEAGEEQAKRQYKKNDWILATGLVCLCAIGAVLMAELIKRRMMM